MTHCQRCVFYIKVTSVIHTPFTNRSLLAAKNEGAWANGRQVRVSDKSSLNKVDIHISWGDKGYLDRLGSLEGWALKL